MRLANSTRIAAVASILLLALCMAMSGCIILNHGLEPISPYYGFTSLRANVHTLTPRLEWKPYSDASAKENFRYQLEILGGNGQRIFKDDLREPYYTVEDPLEPSKEYHWRVRAAWTVEGKPESTDWNYRQRILVTPVGGGWNSRSYSFITPKN